MTAEPPCCDVQPTHFNHPGKRGLRFRLHLVPPIYRPDPCHSQCCRILLICDSKNYLLSFVLLSNWPLTLDYVTVKCGHPIGQGMLCFKMAPKVHFSLEGAATLRTGEWFESRVFPAVGDEVRRLAEGLATLLALVGLFTCIGWQTGMG